MKRYKWLILAGLLIAILGLAVGGCGGTIVITLPGQGDSLPVINSFVADPNNITSGAFSTLIWNVSNANMVSIDQGIGTVESIGSASVSPIMSTTYILTATNDSGSATAAAQVIVSGTPPSPMPAGLPIINSFTATPTIIPAASSTILSWDVSNATSLSISPTVGGVGASGSTLVSPAATTNYTLTASNAAGTTVANIQVIVSTVTPSPSVTVLPVIHYFSADPESIFAGESSTLSWSVSNAPSVTINPNQYRQLSFDPTQSLPFYPSETTTYTLTATNSAGTISETVTVTVNPQPEATSSLNWAGTWDTSWGTMHLSQSAYEVTGTYTWDDGKIVGVAYVSKFTGEKTLKGTWSEEPTYAPPYDAGDFEFTMSPDGNSFTGCWRYGSSGEWEDCMWNGTRISP